MSTEPQFTITRTFEAPRHTVWRAWTDPTLTARWWHPHGLTVKDDSVEMDVRDGGTYRYTMVAPDGREFPTGGTYIEVREPERLRFSWSEPGTLDGAEEAPVITVDLRELDGARCEMTFHLLGLADDSGNDDSVHDGWSEAFEVLDSVVGSAR